MVRELACRYRYAVAVHIAVLEVSVWTRCDMVLVVDNEEVVAVVVEVVPPLVANDARADFESRCY